MVEDMKGKIRVYTRVRPMSGSELERVSVLTLTFKYLTTIMSMSSVQQSKQNVC